MEQLLFISSPVGRLGIAAIERAITRIFFASDTKEDTPSVLPVAGADTTSVPLLRQAAAQLQEYFAGTRREFTLPLAPAGTPFQLRVWQALQTIPYGETRSYGEIAAQIGNPRACRAVGMANHRNPISIVIPCHRVIGGDGSLTGYGGGLETKEFLLRLERAK